MARVCNIGYSTRLLKKSSAIERSNKGGFRSEVFFSYFSKKPNRRPGARSALGLRVRSEGTPSGPSKTQSRFGVSSSSGFRRRNVEIRGPFNAKVRHIDQIDLYPLKRLILGAHNRAPADRAGTAGGGRGCCAGSLWPEMAWMSPPWARAFRTPVEGARLGGRRRLSP